MSDVSVEEIHDVRRRIAEECDHDLNKIGKYFMDLQKPFPERPTRHKPQTKTDIGDKRE
jgi:hypothetical protein